MPNALDDKVIEMFAHGEVVVGGDLFFPIYGLNSIPGHKVTENDLRALFSADELTREFGGQSTLIEDVCKTDPTAVFEIATDILGRVADRASALANDLGRSLAMMEARQVATDRLQSENRKMLESLLAGSRT